MATFLVAVIGPGLVMEPKLTLEEKRSSLLFGTVNVLSVFGFLLKQMNVQWVDYVLTVPNCPSENSEYDLIWK